MCQGDGGSVIYQTLPKSVDKRNTILSQDLVDGSCDRIVFLKVCKSFLKLSIKLFFILLPWYDSLVLYFKFNHFIAGILIL